MPGRTSSTSLEVRYQAPLAPAIEAVVLFVAASNGLLAALNLAPGYPFDGGRLLRLVLLGVVRRPERAVALAGWLLTLALLVWGAAVAATRSRLSGAAGVGIAAVVVLIIIALVTKSALHPGDL